MPCCSTNRSQRSSAITSIRLETERFSKDAICSSLFRCSFRQVQQHGGLLISCSAVLLNHEQLIDVTTRPILQPSHQNAVGPLSSVLCHEGNHISRLLIAHQLRHPCRVRRIHVTICLQD